MVIQQDDIGRRRIGKFSGVMKIVNRVAGFGKHGDAQLSQRALSKSQLNQLGVARIVIDEQYVEVSRFHSLEPAEATYLPEETASSRSVK